MTVKELKEYLKKQIKLLTSSLDYADSFYELERTRVRIQAYEEVLKLLNETVILPE